MLPIFFLSTLYENGGVQNMLSNRNTTVDTKELVTMMAYLIGVKKHIVEKCFDAECHVIQML